MVLNKVVSLGGHRWFSPGEPVQVEPRQTFEFDDSKELVRAVLAFVSYCGS